MKKTLSLFLAIIIAGLCFIPAFAQDDRQGVAVITGSNITGEYMADYKEADELYFTSEIKSIERDAFKDISASVIVFRAAFPEEIKNSGLGKDTVIIMPNSLNGNDNGNCKRYISTLRFENSDSRESNGNWFTYDVLGFFGKTVLVFLYSPVINKEHCDWYDRLVNDISPDFVYFESLNNSGSGFYATGNTSGTKIAEGEGRNANPGFICKLVVRLCLIGLTEKSEYGDNVSFKGLSFLLRLFVKK